MKFWARELSDCGVRRSGFDRCDSTAGFALPLELAEAWQQGIENTKMRLKIVAFLFLECYTIEKRRYAQTAPKK